MSEKVFQLDNPFFRIMGRCADYVILNLLFFFTSLPVITMGASLSAMHAVIALMRKGEEGTLVKTYFHCWIRNFRQCTKQWLVLLAAGLVIGGDLYIVFSAKGGSLQPLLLVSLTAMLTLWLMVFTWSFVTEQREDKGTAGRIREAFLCSVQHLPFTVLMMAVEAVPFMILAVSISVFASVVEPLYMVAGFSASALLCHVLADLALKSRSHDGEA